MKAIEEELTVQYADAPDAFDLTGVIKKGISLQETKCVQAVSIDHH